MSHELRTPLNSILILGQQLSENSDGNLTPKQVEFARTIHGAGTDLLNLISDILDLSKIESGTVTIEAEEIFFANLIDMVARPFRHEADNRKLGFNVEISADLGRSFVTDSKRLQQVLKNLLSNAFKFTAQGGVGLAVRAAAGGWSTEHPVLKEAQGVIAFEVTDTGIGIAPEKQRLIFEAFQQADASTSRKYGGTGLGLAISRELATLLGGEIRLNSIPGQGSTFTLYLPLTYSEPVANGLWRRSGFTDPVNVPALSWWRPTPRSSPTIAPSSLQGDQVLLIIEDDAHYARVLLGLARDKGFKGLVANRGNIGLDLAREYKPAAITLDIFLPDMLGWTVLNNLKRDPSTRHIPVQIISLEEEQQHGLAHGAFSYMVKPVTTEGIEQCLERIHSFITPRVKRLLVIEDNQAESQSIVELLGPRRYRDHRRRHRRRSACGARRRCVRLLRARFALAGHERF